MSSPRGRRPALLRERRPSLPSSLRAHGLSESHAFWERRGLVAALQALWDKDQAPEFLVVAFDDEQLGVNTEPIITELLRSLCPASPHCRRSPRDRSSSTGAAVHSDPVATDDDDLDQIPWWDAKALRMVEAIERSGVIVAQGGSLLVPRATFVQALPTSRQLPPFALSVNSPG